MFFSVDLENSQQEPDSTTLEESSRPEEEDSHLEFISETRHSQQQQDQYETVVELQLQTLGQW